MLLHRTDGRSIVGSIQNWWTWRTSTCVFEICSHSTALKDQTHKYKQKCFQWTCEQDTCRVPEQTWPGIWNICHFWISNNVSFETSPRAISNLPWQGNNIEIIMLSENMITKLLFGISLFRTFRIPHLTSVRQNGPPDIVVPAIVERCPLNSRPSQSFEGNRPEKETSVVYHFLFSHYVYNQSRSIIDMIWFVWQIWNPVHQKK